MYRDFSSSSKSRMIGLVTEVENEKWCDFTDWVGDRWYDFESWIGKLNIKNYINNVNAYHKKVIDKNNATKDTIETIFNNVASVDNSYSSIFANIERTLEQWKRYIDGMSQIVSPGSGKFNAQYIADALGKLLLNASTANIESKIKACVDYDSSAEKYVYNWAEIERVLAADTSSLSDEDYVVLAYVLSTMMRTDENGNVIIDTESVQRFVNAGYTIPALVTSDDYHKSYNVLVNGDKVDYYYIQNKAYLSDTFLKTVEAYKVLFDQNAVNDGEVELNNLLNCIVSNYSVIEWRETVSLLNRDYITGELSIPDDVLKTFNDKCRAKLTIEDINAEDKSGLRYISISSNSFNNGDVVTAYEKDGMINKNKDDDYKDCTIRMYYNCQNANADTIAVKLLGDADLSGYYTEYNLPEEIAKGVIGVIAGFIPGGKYINTAMDLATETDNIKKFSSEVKALKNIDFDKDFKVSENTEKGINGGIDTISKGISIYGSYKKAEANNAKIDALKNESDKVADGLYSLRNLGYTYDTMYITYDHAKHNGDNTISVDNNKDCSKCSSINIGRSDFSFNKDLLRKQYESIMPKRISDQDLDKLCQEAQTYFTTNVKVDGSLLDEYMKKW